MKNCYVCNEKVDTYNPPYPSGINKFRCQSCIDKGLDVDNSKTYKLFKIMKIIIFILGIVYLFLLIKTFIVIF